MLLTEFRQMTLERALLDTTTAGGLVAGLIDLYQTPIAITQLTPLATFTAAVATYVGYAQGVITWALPSVSVDGNVEVVGTVPVFRPTNAVTPNQIYGAYITLAVSGDLAFAAQFDTAPLPMISNLDLIELTVRYRPASQSLIVYIS